jgi:hypothetical protein
MEKPRTDYISRKILGQLYDLVVREDFSPEYTSPFDKRIVEAFDHKDELLRKVESIKFRYDDSLKKIMAQHDIDTEFEVWSGFVMKHNKHKKDYSFVEELSTLMEAIRTNFREECEKDAGGKDPVHLHPFVSAMYVVTARQVHEAIAKLGAAETKNSSKARSTVDPKQMPLISFPWLFMQDLGKIARGAANMSESIYRAQVTQKWHHIKPAIADDRGRGDIETGEGTIPYGELFKAFEDQQQNTGTPKRGNWENRDDQVEMINKNIKVSMPDLPQSRGNIKIKTLGECHKVGEIASIRNQDSIHENDAKAIPKFRETGTTTETRFIPDAQPLLWARDSDKSDDFLLTKKYENFRELIHETNDSIKSSFSKDDAQRTTTLDSSDTLQL